MKILYISQFYNPERVAAAFRAFDNSRLWSNEGHDVTILTGYPNFPTGKIFDGYTPKLLEEETIEGVRVLRSKIIVKENTSKIKRGISALSFMFFGIWNVVFNGKKVRKDYDIVLGTSGTIFAPIIAYIYSVIYRIPFILEIRDITYRQILAVYNGKEKMLYKFVKRIELSLCRKSKKIIVVTNGFKEELIQEGVPKEKIEVITNGVSLDEINYDYDNLKKNNSEFILSYMGNLGASQNLISIIDFFNNLNLKDKMKKLILIGEGAKKNEIKNYLIKNNIKNVVILDGMKKNELDKYYSMSDICIVSLNNNEYFKSTIPSKIFEIMSRKRPILYFGPYGEAAKIIRKSNCGIVCSSHELKENIDKFNREIENLNMEMGMNGFNYLIENHVRDDQAKRYISIMKDVIYTNELKYPKERYIK